MNWYEEIDQRLTPLATAAAKSQCSHVLHVQVQFENGGIKIVTEDIPTPQERRAIMDAVRAALAAHVADASRLRIRASRGFPLMYTMHLDEKTQRPRAFHHLHDIVKFRVSEGELSGLRDAYQELLSLSDEHDFVATTALGGVPGLLHLVEAVQERDGPNSSRAMKFHLFPGLLWTDTDAEADLLFNWLAGLPVSCSVLLFDTGTDGNGPRRMAKAIKQRIATSPAFGPSLITIRGVVDGTNSAQQELDEPLQYVAGHSRLRLSYTHVPRMLTEDCQNLIGHLSLRRQLSLEPINANSVIEFVDESGNLTCVVGATAGAGALRSVIREGVSSTNYNPDVASHLTWFTRAMILSHCMQKEGVMLQNALEGGLIDQDKFNEQFYALEAKYRNVAEASKVAVWDFENKRRGRESI